MAGANVPAIHGRDVLINDQAHPLEDMDMTGRLMSEIRILLHIHIAVIHLGCMMNVSSPLLWTTSYRAGKAERMNGLTCKGCAGNATIKNISLMGQRVGGENVFVF